jgi:hypothetical protein
MDCEPADDLAPAHVEPPKLHDNGEPPKVEKDTHPTTGTDADMIAPPLRVVIPIAGPEGETDLDGAEMHSELAEWHEPEAYDGDHQHDHAPVTFHVLCCPEEFKSVSVLLEQKGRTPWLKRMALLPGGGAHWETSIKMPQSALSQTAYRFIYSKKGISLFSSDIKSRAYDLRPGHLFHKSNPPTSPIYAEFLQYAFNAAPNGERIDALLALHRDLGTPFFTESSYLPFLTQFSVAGLHEASDSGQVLFLALLIGTHLLVFVGACVQALAEWLTYVVQSSSATPIVTKPGSGGVAVKYSPVPTRTRTAAAAYPGRRGQGVSRPVSGRSRRTSACDEHLHVGAGTWG